MSAPRPDAATVSRAVADRRAWAIEATSGWVRHASVLGDERPAQEYIAALLEELGCAVRFVPVDVDRIRGLPGFAPVEWDYDDRPNVVGLLEPRRGGGGRSLVLNGHVDVVSPEPVSLWSHPPFEPQVFDRDGETWLSGRGAADMKGGTIACLWGLAALSDLGLRPAARVVVQSPIEEECTGNGTLALCDAGYLGDACLIPEPFDETLMLRQVGVLWFQVRVLGRTTHVLGAGRGVNAIERSWPIIQALRALEEELNRPEAIPDAYRHVAHPLNLNVGVIRGGDWASTVAGECVTRFRLGLFPGERCADLMARVERVVAEAAAADAWLRDNPPTVEYVGFQAEGCEVDGREPFLQSLAAAHERRRGAPPQPLTATCTTDVRTFVLNHGIPCTCYGPRMRDIHGVDERVSVDSMARVAEVFADLVTDWCGLERS